jgi:flagellar basal-body rod protein FlgB
MTDAIQNAIQVALHGLSDRQRVSADNIANVQTPGFLAGQTNFEDSLSRALNGERGVDLKPTRFTFQGPTNINGNNVDLDNETVSAADTELRYQAMISAMNSKFRILKNAIG